MSEQLLVELKAVKTEILAGLGEHKQWTEGEIGLLRKRMEGLELELQRPGSEGAAAGGAGALGFKDFKTAGARLIEQKELFDLFKQTRAVRFQAGGLWPNFGEKTLIDSAALGFSTPGIVGADRIEPSIVPLPRRRLTVRDLLRARPVTAGQIDFIRESTFTNAASPVVEGVAKAESANTFTIASQKVRTIAHWIPISKQALDDLPELRRFTDENLLYGLKLKEETEILNGDNMGEHLNGITTQATAYAGSYNVSGDTKLDKLRHAILELADAEEECSGFILHPRDFHDIELLKTEEGGANKGVYLVGDPLGGVLRVPTLWRRPVVTTRSMTSGRFLAANFAMAVIGDRMDATIDMSEEHSTFFTENKVAVRCEERIALGVLRTSAFLYGAF